MQCNTCCQGLTDINWSPSWKTIKRMQCKACSKEYNTPSNSRRMYVDGKYINQSHPLHKPGRYESFGDLAFSSLQNFKNLKEGHVYAIRNPAWPEWIKIGKAIDAKDRLKAFNTGSPMRDYELLHFVKTEDNNKAETDAHNIAARLAVPPWDKKSNGEWFKITRWQALEILREVTND